MSWRRLTRRSTAEPTSTAADRRFELPETMPDRFEHDLHPSVRAAAARARVTMDEKRGRVTPQWVLDLANGYLRS
jgi:hypothetical protein